MNTQQQHNKPVQDEEKYAHNQRFYDIDEKILSFKQNWIRETKMIKNQIQLKIKNLKITKALEQI